MLADRRLSQQAPDVGAVADCLPGRIHLAVVGQVVARDDQCPGRGRIDTGDGAQGGGLAGAVSAE